MVAGLCAGVICAWQFGDAFSERVKPRAPVTVADLTRQVDPASAIEARDTRPLPPARPVYPYSVVSGGVHSVDELRIAMRFDPVVAAHFSDFDLSRTRIERVAVSRAVFVSYRSGSRVAWTSRRVTLQAGETILTDGQNQARTRCGNRIKEVAPAEISKEEPPVETFDMPVPSRTVPIEPLEGYDMLVADGGLPALDAQEVLLPSVPLTAMSMRELPTPDVPQPPIIPVIPEGGSPTPFNNETPEPGTLLLVSPALGLFALIRRLRRRG
jgi:hypothetical protein